MFDEYIVNFVYVERFVFLQVIKLKVFINNKLINEHK